MAGGGDFEPGLARAKRMEKNTQSQGRTGGKSPEFKFRGDKNKTMGGGINRSLKSNTHK